MLRAGTESGGGASATRTRPGIRVELGAWTSRTFRNLKLWRCIRRLGRARPGESGPRSPQLERPAGQSSSSAVAAPGTDPRSPEPACLSFRRRPVTRLLHDGEWTPARARAGQPPEKGPATRTTTRGLPSAPAQPAAAAGGGGGGGEGGGGFTTPHRKKAARAGEGKAAGPQGGRPARASPFPRAPPFPDGFSRRLATSPRSGARPRAGQTPRPAANGKQRKGDGGAGGRKAGRTRGGELPAPLASRGAKTAAPVRRQQCRSRGDGAAAQ